MEIRAGVTPVLPLAHIEAIVAKTLARWGISPTADHRTSFAQQVQDCQQYATEREQRIRTPEASTDNIFFLIQQAKHAGNQQEALWGATIAAYFGTLSALPPHDTSAARFLCAFGAQQPWTYSYVSRHWRAFQKELAAHTASLQNVRFGSHRAYLPHTPMTLTHDFNSLLAWVQRNGGTLEKAFSPSSQNGFHELYGVCGAKEQKSS